MATEKNQALFKYYVFYKPYNVLNQFSKERPEHTTLADFLKVQNDVYPVGRLDKDSEGLLILTNDKALNARLLSPVKGHIRVYLVQVDGDITQQAVVKMSRGVDISLEKGMYHTRPCDVKKLPKEPVLPDRNPPVRFRKNIPTSWIRIELSEGKNRQVRKMCAAVGFPVLRLVRVQIEQLKIGKLEPGKSYELSREELFEKLNLDINVKSSATSGRNSEQKNSGMPKKKSSIHTYRQAGKTRKK
jgi:23S rRNA pseudouridine2457 synthase